MCRLTSQFRISRPGCSLVLVRHFDKDKRVTAKEPLSVTHPELARQAVGWDPNLVTAGSHKEVAWRCQNAHSWNARISNRTYLGNGCPICSTRRTRRGETDLATTHPKIAKQAIGWDPTKYKAGSQKTFTWKCESGHEWKARIASRALQGTNCPYCKNRMIHPGLNDLATTHPDIAKEAFEWDPSTVSAGSGVKRKWRCPLGHIWIGVVGTRTQRKFTCPFCSGRQVLVGFNDLASKYPELSREADGWDPRTLTAGSGKKVRWKCEEGHSWSATVLNRAFAGNGCPRCALYGFNPGEKAFLYFLKHEEWGMYQIGISNDIDRRLKKHTSRGWELIELRGPMDGLITREWEKSILQMLTRHGARLGPEEVTGRFDGYTEAWITESFQASSLGDLMDAVRRDEDRS